MARLSKGQRHPGSGRKKGIPSKKTQMLEDRCKALGVDPFDVLLHFAKGDWESLGYKSETIVVGATASGKEILAPVIPPDLRKSSAKDACEYIHAKRKAIEHTGENGEALKTVVVFETTWRDTQDDSKGDT